MVSSVPISIVPAPCKAVAAIEVAAAAAVAENVADQSVSWDNWWGILNLTRTSALGKLLTLAVLLLVSGILYVFISSSRSSNLKGRFCPIGYSTERISIYSGTSPI